MTAKAGRLGLLLAGLLAGAILIGQMPTAMPAPEAEFTTLTGDQLSLKSLAGKPVLVTFWATDCPACLKEIPHLRELYRSYHRQGLEIIAVAMYYDPPSHVVAMSRAQELPYPVALDLHAEQARAFGNVRLTPTSILIAPNGRIVQRITGAFDLGDMKAAIENLLPPTETQADAGFG